MKFIKTFENHNSQMSREEMCDVLCSMGYEMGELEVCSDSELADICREQGIFENIFNTPRITLGFEDEDTENYMFFANIENICRMCREILEMDKYKVDEILSDGHAWAVDHVATSKDDMEEVYGFLKASHTSK